VTTAPLTLATTGLFLTACVVSDLRTRRIPNTLTLSGMALGLFLGGATQGFPGLAASAGGMLLAMTLLVPPFALGGIGGGDVKMMAAVGSLVGTPALLASLLAGMILGGLVAVGVLWRRGRLREKLQAVGAMTRSALLTRSLDPLRAPAPTPDAVTLPYSVPLGLGTALALSVRCTLGT
jgi:prepilin peptidase CpaA